MIDSQIRKRALLHMALAAAFAIISLGGAVMLAHNGRSSFAWVWIAIGLANIYLYWRNMLLYRRHEPKRT